MRYTVVDIVYRQLTLIFQGYRIAVVYDRLDHGRSMDAVRSRITRATLPFHLTSSHGHSVIHFDGEDDDVDEMMTNGGQGIARSKRYGPSNWLVMTSFLCSSTDKLSSSGSSGRLRRPATPGRTHPDHGKMQRCSQSKSTYRTPLDYRNPHPDSGPIPPRHRASESRHASSNLAADNSETLSMASSRLRLSQSTGSLADRQRTKPIPGPPKPIAPPPNLRPINGRGPRSPLAPIKVIY